MLTDLSRIDVVFNGALFMDLILIGLVFARLTGVALRSMDCFTCRYEDGSEELDRAADKPHREPKVASVSSKAGRRRV